jgi:hypothetical protein
MATSPYSPAQRKRFRTLATIAKLVGVATILLGAVPLLRYYARLPQLRLGSESEAEMEFYFGVVCCIIAVGVGCVFRWLGAHLVGKTKGALK